MTVTVPHDVYVKLLSQIPEASLRRYKVSDSYTTPRARLEYAMGLPPLSECIARREVDRLAGRDLDEAASLVGVEREDPDAVDPYTGLTNRERARLR